MYKKKKKKKKKKEMSLPNDSDNSHRPSLQQLYILSKDPIQKSSIP